ncbi:MAG: redox-sensing transcriptional repressor Rex [Planctomycetaceae bacterium]|nr:redox-sensing transcriptional repressor Rex [Planctomycetaceae bacterium]MBP63855.1 redox-sensing transcriptional repressor Rex [Planctomycetaceae bacterium]
METTNDGQVPRAVVHRLSLYLRELQQLIINGRSTTSSTQLGKLLGFTDAQVRKDLAHFGQFGYPGIGYRCEELIVAIKSILGTDHEWPVAIVGVGNLGRALLGYRGFHNQGFRVVAAFDTDPEKVGEKFEGILVYPTDQISEFIRQHSIRLAMIAVPASSAQIVADELVRSGVEGIVNFAPVTLAHPAGIWVERVDLAIELEQLSFSVVNRQQNT